MDASEFIDKVLSHAYSSQYYDPVKAHQYYERTKQLKGRRSASQLGTQSKKDKWGYVKNQIGEAKKSELEQISAQSKADAQKLRGLAASRREELKKKLQALMADATDKAAADIDQIQKDMEKKIEALPPIPKSATGSRRALLIRARQEEIKKIKGEAASSKAKVSKDSQGQRKSEAAGLTADREALAGELKNSVAKARETYKARREAVKAKYEAVSDREFEAIRQGG